jgi:hypothetical protein
MIDCFLQQFPPDAFTTALRGHVDADLGTVAL